ncbi:hypothetical protein HanXRQr2_Chr03g0097561 [Helianthus annuus]|uniref:Uncharacterized protein n=1 Tax=Helianthus annuus TaxID=4232 RepID=A0A9K3JDC9_HELAN|nr:hypothetical protein HanXRQr2_Chr03g0097561 [Helianthus annuus]KAJ0942603.1 hypothetical protein HanPSC8_Chr03g0093971 [Helianthus annuus]
MDARGDVAVRGGQPNRMTMHDISSLLFLANASVVRRLAAAKGSLMDFTISTASVLLITCIKTFTYQWVNLGCVFLSNKSKSLDSQFIFNA